MNEKRNTKIRLHKLANQERLLANRETYGPLGKPAPVKVQFVGVGTLKATAHKYPAVNRAKDAFKEARVF